MIYLPKLKIERSEFRETWLIEKQRAWLKEQDKLRGSGIHASDLLDTRRAYWQSVLPKEHTEKEIGLFVVGRVLHSLILAVVNPEHDEFAADSGSSEKFGIIYSPDWRDGSIPVEAKTNRSTHEPHEYNLQKDLYLYLEQTCIYAALDNSMQAELWVYYISLKDETGRTYPTPRCYVVELTEQQLENIREQVFDRRDLLLQAKEERNPNLLEPCRAWKCAEACSWWNDCRPPGRFPNTDKRKWTV